MKHNKVKEEFYQKKFLDKANEIHKEKYDYSLVKYVSSETKVPIICKKHGRFMQTPHSHLKGQGCPLCNVDNRRKTTNQFIEDSIKIHGDKYDYSKVEYKSAKEKVCIICQKHGEFYISPNSHLSKHQGCPKCANESMKVRSTKTKYEFIKEAKEIHGYKYDYSKTEYKGVHIKTIITCPIHGDFFQEPNAHLKGQGCPICKESHLERHINNLLTENSIEFVRQYKNMFLGLQSLDFYLPKYNIAIECQGTQHINGRWFRNVNKLSHDENIITKDVLKHNKCLNNNVHLIYIFEREKSKNEAINNFEKFKGIYTVENTFSIKDDVIEKIRSNISVTP